MSLSVGGFVVFYRNGHACEIKHYIYLGAQGFARNSVFFVASLISYLCQSILAITLVAAGTAQVLTVAALKIYQHFDLSGAIRFQKKLMEFEKRFPWLQIAGFIATIVVGLFYFPVGCAIGIVVGIYVGLLSSTHFYNALQKAKHKDPYSYIQEISTANRLSPNGDGSEGGKRWHRRSGTSWKWK